VEENWTFQPTTVEFAMSVPDLRRDTLWTGSSGKFAPNKSGSQVPFILWSLADWKNEF
jgi:hypothetical protein